MTELKEFLERRYIKNNLEKFFEDLYREELKYKIEKSEVKYIKRGIENLVQNIATLVFIHGRDEIESIKSDYEFSYPGLIYLDKHDECVLKVGSVYDKTKNKYPNEFDFILTLFTFFCDSDSRYGYVKFGYTYTHKFKYLHHLIKTLLSSKHVSQSLVYKDPRENDKEIRFEKYLGLFGSSSKLCFFYQKGDSNYTINVDIVLSVRRIDPMIQWRFLSTQHEFNEELGKTGSVLFVNEKLTVTETEVDFVRHVLSAKHRKALRILKYLINGNGDGEILDRVIRTSGHFGERITSHMIKTEMILHHYRCHHTDRAVSPCVLEILECFKYYDSNNSLPSLTHVTHTPHFFRSVDKLCALEVMTETLNGMRTAQKPYRFDKDRITPIAASLLVYPKQQVPERTETKINHWICCIGTYCINISEGLFALSLFVIFLMGLIYYM